MSRLDHILKEYAAFETEVIAFTSELLMPWCCNCRGGCCKAEYCRESLDSSFLSLLLSKYPPQTTFSTREGWLTETGCALAVGRPPVCYEFLCDRVLDARPALSYRYAMDILSRLILHIGQKAVGRSHLVEILDPSELSAININTFGQRLTEARQAFQVISSILTDQPIPADSAGRLSKISLPPGGQVLWD
jgi:hypothetical protein